MEARPSGKPRPIVTTDLAVFASSSAESARLRDEHLWPVVFDANTMIRDALHNTMPDKKPSALMDALVVGTARLYGKPDLLDEVAGNLAEVAEKNNHDLARAREILAFYVSRMRLVDPSGVVIPDAEERFAKVDARRARDARSDEPTARLTRLLDPAILLTADKDLLDNDFGIWYEPGERLATWTAAAFTLKDRSVGSQMDAGAKMVGLAVSLPAAAGAGLIEMARAHPRAALGMGALAVALGLATRKSTGWEAARTALAEGFNQVMAEAAERFPANPARQQQATRDAIEQLATFRTEHASPGSPVAAVARTLAIAPVAGLTAKEIYDSTEHRFAIWPVLDMYPRLFTEDSAGRWHLGNPAILPG